MTTRTAEILFATILALCSVGLMLKSAELNIGWVPNEGPGAGAWPFWLSAGMLLSCIATIIRWFRGKTPESRSLEPYMTRDSVIIVGSSAGAILALLLITQFAGIYIALPLFMLAYVRFIGGHSWKVSVSLAIVVPFTVFALFEWALQIPLPKAFTDPWFYPVYDLMYAQDASDALGALQAPVVFIPLIAFLATVFYWLTVWGKRLGKSPASTAGGSPDS